MQWGFCQLNLMIISITCYIPHTIHIIISMALISILPCRTVRRTNKWIFPRLNFYSPFQLSGLGSFHSLDPARDLFCGMELTFGWALEHCENVTKVQTKVTERRIQPNIFFQLTEAT